MALGNTDGGRGHLVTLLTSMNEGGEFNIDMIWHYTVKTPRQTNQHSIIICASLPPGSGFSSRQTQRKGNMFF